MEKNVGQTDLIIRAILGVVLIIAYFTTAFSWGWIMLLVGIVMLGTAALGTCPPYKLLGINTCKRS